MLPPIHKALFLLFAAVTVVLGCHGFYRLYRRISVGGRDADKRFNQLPKRIAYALITTLMQSRTFRKRPVVSLFHSFIFYGFALYLLVNLVDAIEGYVVLHLEAAGIFGEMYTLAADILSALVLIGVVALVLRRFLLPSRQDFRFNERTLLHKDVRQAYIRRDSLFVSVFILIHVGSRTIGSAARIAVDGPTRFAPFATLLSHLVSPQHAVTWQIYAYWGALGSILVFLSYFPYTKHVHIFMAPLKYAAHREVNSGTLPAMDLDIQSEEPKLGAKMLEDLAWPRLLDAYACIQCNRCQDVCPATATGKALSPSALEINKRMELNDLAWHRRSFETGGGSETPLLTFALSHEALWACTTCGACIDICPVQDEPMLDIIDIRRQQVMMEGEFPQQLQTAFRGMERTKNPWGINHEKRMDWAADLSVKTIEENPEPEVLFWVGCAASYDPQSQKTARAFVELLNYAEVDFAVLGKRECCTGDSARRAGNEYLYRQLADENVRTLNEVKPKLIVATCPHCMNSLGNEYNQIGGDYEVLHHTQYLERLISERKLVATPEAAPVAYHDPCYLGRHNGVYDAPRNLLRVLNSEVIELPRNRENSFCCGAGGAQFWKEEEPGTERISDNRYREAAKSLDGVQQKTLAVGCPFCKSMLESTPAQGETAVAVRDVAELLLEGVRRNLGAVQTQTPAAVADTPTAALAYPIETTCAPVAASISVSAVIAEPAAIPISERSRAPERKKWTPKAKVSSSSTPTGAHTVPPQPAPTAPSAEPEQPVSDANPKRKLWPKSKAQSLPKQTETSSGILPEAGEADDSTS